MEAFRVEEVVSSLEEAVLEQQSRRAVSRCLHITVILIYSQGLLNNSPLIPGGGGLMPGGGIPIGAPRPGGIPIGGPIGGRMPGGGPIIPAERTVKQHTIRVTTGPSVKRTR